MLDLVSLQYLDLLRQLKRGNYRGIISNAKPLLMLSIISAIEKGMINDNRIRIDEISNVFIEISKRYNPNLKPTLVSYPFYHLLNEPFYHLTWIGEPMKIEAPSIKWVKDHIEYAYLDEALWELLQAKESRDYFRNAIEEYYLK